jgi:hypothetical protein
VPSVEAIVFGFVGLATLGLIGAHRRARTGGPPISLAAAIGTGVILGLMTVEVVMIVVLAVAGAASAAR